MKLSTGRKIDENIIGLSDGEKDTYVMVYGGYEASITTILTARDAAESGASEGEEVWSHEHAPILESERAELANVMIDRWKKWGQVVTVVPIEPQPTTTSGPFDADVIDGVTWTFFDVQSVYRHPTDVKSVDEPSEVVARRLAMLFQNMNERLKLLEAAKVLK